MKRDAQPMSPAKFRIKLLKHALWLLLALWTGFTFVGYFTPIKELSASVLSASLGSWEIFWIFYAAFLYLMAGFMREQMCKYMCPYARFQGVMFDPDTLIITYDPERGEPRGLRKKTRPPKRRSWATASTAAFACRSAPPALISATACSLNASPVPPASTPVMR